MLSVRTCLPPTDIVTASALALCVTGEFVVREVQPGHRLVRAQAGEDLRRGDVVAVNAVELEGVDAYLESTERGWARARYNFMNKYCGTNAPQSNVCTGQELGQPELAQLETLVCPNLNDAAADDIIINL